MSGMKLLPGFSGFFPHETKRKIAAKYRIAFLIIDCFLDAYYLSSSFEFISIGTNPKPIPLLSMGENVPLVTVPISCPSLEYILCPFRGERRESDISPTIFLLTPSCFCFKSASRPINSFSRSINLFSPDSTAVVLSSNS